MLDNQTVTKYFQYIFVYTCIYQMNSFTLHHTTKANQMKTIYLREKKSGNFEIVTGKFNQAEHTHKFKTWTALQDFYQKLYGSKIIKAEYSRSTIYFNSFNQLKALIKAQ